MALRPWRWLLCRLAPRCAFFEHSLFCSSHPPGQWRPQLRSWLRLLFFLVVLFAARLSLPWRFMPRAGLPAPVLDGFCPGRRPALPPRLALQTVVPAATRTLNLSVSFVAHVVLPGRLSALRPVPLTLLVPSVVSFAPWLDAVRLGYLPALST